MKVFLNELANIRGDISNILFCQRQWRNKISHVTFVFYVVYTNDSLMVIINDQRIVRTIQSKLMWYGANL